MKLNIQNLFCSFWCCVRPVLITLTDKNKGVQNINENSNPGVDVDDVSYAMGWNGMECFVIIYACVCLCVCVFDVLQQLGDNRFVLDGSNGWLFDWRRWTRVKAIAIWITIQYFFVQFFTEYGV